MKNYPFVRFCWNAVSVFLVVSSLLVLYSLGWEFATRSYLRGFSDAIIPSADTPQQKAETILTWMGNGSVRRTAVDLNMLAARDPENTLNYRQLLEICGTATNAFLNLAESSGLPARRLLLLDQHRLSKHVVAEVRIDNRWVVVDPSYHFMPQVPEGHFLTRDELESPVIFHKATQMIPDYPSSYSYESTVHVRLGRIPIIGRYMRRALNFIWPAWEENFNWTLLVERESFATFIVSILALGFGLTARLCLGWYSYRRLGIVRVRLRDQIMRAWQYAVQ